MASEITKNDDRSIVGVTTSQVCNEQQQLGGGKQVVGSKQKLAVPASSFEVFKEDTLQAALRVGDTLYIPHCPTLW